MDADHVIASASKYRRRTRFQAIVRLACVLDGMDNILLALIYEQTFASVHCVDHLLLTTAPKSAKPKKQRLT